MEEQLETVTLRKTLTNAVPGPYIVFFSLNYCFVVVFFVCFCNAMHARFQYAAAQVLFCKEKGNNNESLCPNPLLYYSIFCVHIYRYFLCCLTQSNKLHSGETFILIVSS